MKEDLDFISDFGVAKCSKCDFGFKKTKGWEGRLRKHYSKVHGYRRGISRRKDYEDLITIHIGKHGLNRGLSVGSFWRSD